MRKHWLAFFIFCAGTAHAQFVKNTGIVIVNSANVTVNSDWDNTNASFTNNGTITTSDNWTSTGGYSQAGTGGFVLTNTATKQFNHAGQYVGTLTKNGAGNTQINNHLIIKTNLTLTNGLLTMTGANDTLITKQGAVIGGGSPTSYVVGKISRYGTGDLFFPVSAGNYMPITIFQVQGVNNPRTTVTIQTAHGGATVSPPGNSLLSPTPFPYTWRSDVVRYDTASYIEVQYPTSMPTAANPIVVRSLTSTTWASMGLQSVTTNLGVTKIRSFANGRRGQFTIGQGGIAAPVASAGTSITATGFSANWASVAGATGYQLDVSADNFVTKVSGFNSLAVAGTSAAVTGLSGGTAYKYRVRAMDASTISINSNVIDVLTALTAPVATAATGVTANGFTAKWGVVPGVTTFRLDVSADNFGTFVSGFDNLAVTGTSFDVTGLSAATNYKFRLRATGTAPTSLSSNAISVATALFFPATATATSATTGGFTANWGAVTGATGYELDVSADNFVTLLPGFAALAVTGLSAPVTGLNPATAYKYRVRATSANFPTSVNSSSMDATTLGVPAPTVVGPTLITPTGFTANWSAASGITAHQLDVSADDFVTLVTGFSSLAVTGTSAIVTGLASNTVYKFRVRSVLGTFVSVNSNVGTATTLQNITVAPGALAATAITQTGFTANWGTGPGVTGFQLDVSADNFLTFVTGFNSLATIATSVAVTGLTANTPYKYRVRATSTLPVSVNSNVIDVTTLAKVAQTITFAAIPDKNLGDPVFALGATASSALAVNYATGSDKITIVNGQATIVKAGRETVEASQPGNGTFSAATTVARSFCIKPAKPVATISSGNNTETPILSSNASAGNQWYFNGTAIATGATNPTYNVAAPGVYKVQVNVDGCLSDFSADVAIIVTGDINKESSHISAYPNPVEDYLEVRGVKGEIGGSQLIDMTGRQSSIGFEKKDDVYRASVQHLSTGVYLLRLQDGAAIHQIKFIKK